MRILVTNDDGVSAPGIHALAIAVAELGHDVVVAAPLEDKSGSGAAIGSIHLDDHIDVEPFTIPHAPEITAFGIAGTPALAVMAARLGAFGDAPELVVSGINPGLNTGRSTLHSGTVGATLTGANFGVSGLAVSIDTEGGEPQWATAADLAQSALGWLIDAPERTVLNLNVPNVAPDQVRGVRWARLAPFGTVRAAVAESSDGRIQMELTATGVELPADTDTALVHAGYAAITSIVGIRAAEWSGVAEFVDERHRRRVG
ncbi:MAG: 5'/3'-nucleotidase SurE [Acidimicrobiales bacterium]